MPTFQYRALGPDGALVSGSADADTRSALTALLQKKSLLPIEVGEARSGSCAAGEGGRETLGASSFGLGAVRREDVRGLTDDLSILLGSGVQLDRALMILEQGADRPRVAHLIQSLNRVISGGRSFAEALSLHPSVFPAGYVAVVAAAETSGTLASTLNVLSQELRRAEEMRRRVASALTYPAVLFAAACAVLVFVMLAVIPQFDAALGSGSRASDKAPVLIFAMSHALVGHKDLVGASALVLVAALYAAAKSRRCRRAGSAALARLPGLATLVRYERTATFCAMLAMLLRSGVDIAAALRLIRDAMRDSRAADTLDGVQKAVRQGRPLSEALLESDLLPLYAVQMLRVGEESRLADSAAKVASVYGEKLSRALARLTAALGPVVLLAISAFISWIIISVMTALLSLNEAIL